jgi:hypothetical protein
VSRARSIRRARSDAGIRLPPAARSQHELERLSQLAGNRAVARLLQRKVTDAPPVKGRAPIDELAKRSVTPVERTRAYAEIAGTEAVRMDPKTVHTTAFYQDGINLDALKQARNIPAQTGFLDADRKFSGGRPPENPVGVAIVVNSAAASFEDEDYMVAAIRHEMVHARLLRLTLEHLAAWKRAKGAGSFSQYVEKQVGGTEAALLKDRYFGGHMDEAPAYAEGFLSAFFYSPIEEPQPGDRAWLRHLKGFAKEFAVARLNSGPLPKSRARIPEETIAAREGAGAGAEEAEKLVKQYCESGGRARCQNLAAWMQWLYTSGGMQDAAVSMIYKAATGRAMPTRKR